jgi:hypothetical protein
MADPVSVTTHIKASPQVVYDLVSDLPRMGEWSPENTGGRWLGGATGPAPGVRFRGSNRDGIRRWSTTVTVAEATPGKAFVFDVSVGPWKVARWAYHLAPSEGGCDVTESWEDRRAGWMKTVSGPVTGVSDRATHNAENIRTTLERVKAAAEAHAG